MKRWTIGGLSILVIGFVAFSFRGGCQVELHVEDNPPVEQMMGWDEDAAQSEATQQLVAQMPDFEIEGVWRDNSRANVRFWEYAEQIGVDYTQWLDYQEWGDCVSWGAAGVVNWVQCVQIALGQQAEFREIYPPYIYATSRVYVGRNQLRGRQGSVGAWAAKAVQEYGVLACDETGVPAYSGSIARQWGDAGPPEKFVPIAKRTPIKTVSPMRSAQDCCDAITNGYGVTIASNFGTNTIRERDGRMVALWDSKWPHQMHLCGYDGSAPSGERYFYCLNSHGRYRHRSRHPAPLQGEPAGGFWLTWADVDRICRQGDSFAFSSFVGFPAQDLDFTIFETQASLGAGVEDIRREALMLAVSTGACAVVLVGCMAVIFYRRRSRGLALLTLCAVLPTAAMGQEPDFSLFGSSDAIVQSDEGICFDVFGQEAPCPDTLNFAMLDQTQCNCEETGVCLCPETCQCPNCPRKKKPQADTRPVITVRTVKNCGPCEQCKKDAATLKDFRFQFVEQQSVPGGAPCVEWQGVQTKWTITGWHGVDFFKRAYEKSQKPKTLMSQRLISQPQVSYQPLPVLPRFTMSQSSCVNGACSSGSCRTCR